MVIHVAIEPPTRGNNENTAKAIGIIAESISPIIASDKIAEDNKSGICNSENPKISKRYNINAESPTVINAIWFIK